MYWNENPFGSIPSTIRLIETWDVLKYKRYDEVLAEKFVINRNMRCIEMAVWGDKRPSEWD